MIHRTSGDMDKSRQKKEIEDLIIVEQFDQALTLLKQFWRRNRDAASAAWVTGRYEKLRSGLKEPLAVKRIFCLRSFTLEPIVPFVRAEGLLYGLDIAVEFGAFNAYVQELMNSESALYKHSPDIVVCAVQLADFRPDLDFEFADKSAEAVEQIALEIESSFASWLQTFRQLSTVPLLIHTFELPVVEARGILDSRMKHGQRVVVTRINESINALCREHAAVYALDYAALVGRCGVSNWHDHKKAIAYKMPLTPLAILLLAQEWLRFIVPLSNKSCKALVVDLDDTLWGGKAGEEGLSGVALGPQSYPGAAFSQLQRVILNLAARGILIAVNSKNNAVDAMEIIERHPEMLLRTRHFSSVQINWNDKATNMMEIARELQIGLDSMAFLDNEPFERENMRSRLPQVFVIDLPADPMLYAETIHRLPVFERLSLLQEDISRTEYYQEERLRKSFQETAGSLQEFLFSLKLEAEVSEAVPETFERVAQLTQKTNQFNMTTRRYSEPEIKVFSENPDWRVFQIGASDRFGRSGLVGVAITHDQGTTRDIDTFLLSCRVIGRGIETALLSAICRNARQLGVKVIKGRFMATSKNVPAKDFFSLHGFQDSGEGTWCLNLETADVLMPEWIKVTVKTSKDQA